MPEQREFKRNERRFGRRLPKREREDREFERKTISINRVAKVTAGSKRLRMSVLVVVGDRKGRVGIGLGRGADTKSAIEKAAKYGQNHLTKIDLMGDTIPHEVTTKYRAAKLIIKPGGPGTGIIASAPVRAVMEVAGVRNVLSKQFGSNNPIANAYCTYKALKMLDKKRILERLRKMPRRQPETKTEQSTIKPNLSKPAKNEPAHSDKKEK